MTEAQASMPDHIIMFTTPANRGVSVRGEYHEMAWWECKLTAKVGREIFVDVCFDKRDGVYQASDGSDGAAEIYALSVICHQGMDGRGGLPPTRSPTQRYSSPLFSAPW